MTGAVGAAGRLAEPLAPPASSSPPRPARGCGGDRPRDSAVNPPTPTIRTNAAQMTMIRTSSMTGRDYRWRRP